MKRIQGLDIIRGGGIFFIFMWHYPRMDKQVLGGALGGFGWSMIDMFFVLSGYLIGQQLFKALKNERFSLTEFMGKRLLRTLPNYYFILLLVFLFPGIDGKSNLPELWKFLTFTQNFDLVFSSFSHAWSLCVEEQFYLILPLLGLLLHRRMNIVSVSILLFSVLAVIIALRYSIWHGIVEEKIAYFRGAFFTRIWYPTYTRLDGLTIGVGMALLKVFRPAYWSWLLARSNWCLGVGVALLTVAFYTCQNITSIETSLYGLTLVALGFAFLITGSIDPKSLMNRFQLPVFHHLAKWSFAFYLVHKICISLAGKAMMSFGVSVHSFASIFASFALTLAASWAMYELIEVPTLRWRQRWLERRRQRASTNESLRPQPVVVP